MRKKIITILGMTSEQYEDIIWETYWNWCKKYATSENNCQSLLANAAVNRWFMLQYAKFEKQFIELIEHFPKKVSDPRYHYQGLCSEIFCLHPKPIIESCKIQNPEFSFNINQTTKIYGN